MGTSIATAFARTIDPSFIADGIWDAKRPWVGSPLVSGMNVLRVWKAPLSSSDSTLPASAAATPATTTGLESGVGGDGLGNRSTESLGRGEEEEDGKEKGVGPWVNYGAHRLKEGHVDLLIEAGAQRQQRQVSNTATIASMDPITATSTNTTTASQQLQGLTSYKRRRYFTTLEHRRAAVLAPDLVIAGDFFNNFTNFETRRVSMGVSIRMDRVMRDDQPLRFVCKSRLCLSARQQEERQGQEKGWAITRRIRRNRRRRSKHEDGSTVVFGGGRNVGEGEEEMDIVIGDSDEDDDTETIDDDGGEGDEHQEEMSENKEEIVFFVVELRWDQASMVL